MPIENKTLRGENVCKVGTDLMISSPPSVQAWSMQCCWGCRKCTYLYIYIYILQYAHYFFFISPNITSIWGYLWKILWWRSLCNMLYIYIKWIKRLKEKKKKYFFLIILRSLGHRRVLRQPMRQRCQVPCHGGREVPVSTSARREHWAVCEGCTSYIVHAASVSRRGEEGQIEKRRCWVCVSTTVPELGTCDILKCFIQWEKLFFHFLVNKFDWG